MAWSRSGRVKERVMGRYDPLWFILGVVGIVLIVLLVVDVI